MPTSTFPSVKQDVNLDWETVKWEASRCGEMIYAFFPQSAGYEDAGLYVFSEQTQEWYQCKMQGINDDIDQIAIHPDNPNIITVYTRRGLFVSRNQGDNFKAISRNVALN